MVLSHGAYYGFFSIHLEQIGFGNLFMGVSWAVAVVSEIAVMILAKPMVRRFSPERLLMFCLIVAAGRWAALGWFNTPVIVLLSQLLHAFTYAAFHITSVIYMDELSPSGAKTMGQSINNSVQYGLGMMAGFFLSGYLLEKAGGGIAFLVSSGMAIAAFAIMGIHLRLSRVGRGQGYRVSP
jgi:PPP family 3-phenylpropionic acid transporter